MALRDQGRGTRGAVSNHLRTPVLREGKQWAKVTQKPVAALPV